MSNTPHASARPGEHTVPEVTMDHCSLTSDTSLTVLVIKGRDSEAILVHPVLRQGRLQDDTVDQ
eukprot:14118450-Alexandrium_andersonii.AAC.1